MATYAWYSLAAASGKKDARLVRDIYIKDDLEPSKIVRGQEMAKENMGTDREAESSGDTL